MEKFNLIRNKKKINDEFEGCKKINSLSNTEKCSDNFILMLKEIQKIIIILFHKYPRPMLNHITKVNRIDNILYELNSVITSINPNIWTSSVDNFFELVNIENPNMDEVVLKNRINYVNSNSNHYRKMSKLDLNLIYKRLISSDNENQITVKELAIEFGTSYSLMWRAVTTVLQFTRKKCNKLKKNPSDELMRNMTLNYAEFFLDFFKKDYYMIFFDESKFNNTKRSGYKWIPKGGNNIIFDGGRLSSLNLLICLSHTGFKFHEIIKTNMNSFILIDFINKLIDEISLNDDLYERYKKGKIVLIYDNASMHRSREFLKFVRTTKLNILSIPPYKPFLNIVEYVFSFMKRSFYNLSFKNM